MKNQILKRMLAVLLGVSMVLPSMPSLATEAVEIQAEESQKIEFESVPQRKAEPDLAAWLFQKN